MQFVYFVSAIHPELSSSFTFASNLNKKGAKLDWERHLALSQALPGSPGILLGSRFNKHLGMMMFQGLRIHKAVNTPAWVCQNMQSLPVQFKNKCILNWGTHWFHWECKSTFKESGWSIQQTTCLHLAPAWDLGKG